MKRVKKNKRNKNIVGTLIEGGIGALSSIINGIMQRNAINEQQKQQTLNGNLQNLMMQQNNLDQVYSNNAADELALAKTDNVSTLHSAMCFGGKRRMKRAGGTISANVKGLDRYI